MVANDAVRNLIREGKTYQIDNTIATNMKSGMCSLDYYLAELTKRGLITRETAIARCKDPDEYRRYLAAAGTANAVSSNIFSSLEY